MAAAPTMLAFPPDIWERAIEHLPAEQRAQFTWRIPHMRQSLSRLGTQPLDGTAVEDATADVVVTVAAMMPALRKIPAFDELLRELPAHIDSTLDTLRSALDDDSAFAALRWTGRRLQSLF
ncbi:MAG: hypothetical protein MJD61_11065, partial [Proteobacteria bacterium]|nr:hypothetical protein [Pseudomonadota bacterium]